MLFCLQTLSSLGCPKQSRPPPGARCSTESVLEGLRVESVLLKSVDAFCDVTRERSHLTASMQQHVQLEAARDRFLLRNEANQHKYEQRYDLRICNSDNTFDLAISKISKCFNQ